VFNYAAQVLNFINSPKQLLLSRKAKHMEKILSEMDFKRIDIGSNKGFPDFKELHHTIGKFHQPVHAVNNLIDLNFFGENELGVNKPTPVGKNATHLPTEHVAFFPPELIKATSDPFDTSIAFPSQWSQRNLLQKS